MVHRKIIIVFNGLFLFLDQFLKWRASRGWVNQHTINGFFGWLPFVNRGAAFSLPISNLLIVVITTPMLALIGYLIYKSWRAGKIMYFAGWMLIFTGALSNLLDRMAYKYVIDYFLIGTGVINIADILIVLGVALLALKMLNINIIKY